MSSGPPYINPQTVDNIVARINAIPDVPSLTALETELQAMLGKWVAAQLKELETLVGLNTPPTTPNEAVTWVTNFISVHITGPYNKAVELGTEIATASSRISTAIANKLSSLQAQL
jgi:hypothetical protein